MSPVSPVVHTEATVSIELKNVLRVGGSDGLDSLHEVMNHIYLFITPFGDIFQWGTKGTLPHLFNSLPTFIWDNKEG